MQPPPPPHTFFQDNTQLCPSQLDWPGDSLPAALEEKLFFFPTGLTSPLNLLSRATTQAKIMLLFLSLQVNNKIIDIQVKRQTFLRKQNLQKPQHTKLQHRDKTLLSSGQSHPQSQTNEAHRELLLCHMFLSPSLPPDLPVP